MIQVLALTRMKVKSFLEQLIVLTRPETDSHDHRRNASKSRYADVVQFAIEFDMRRPVSFLSVKNVVWPYFRRVYTTLLVVSRNKRELEIYRASSSKFMEE